MFSKADFRVPNLQKKVSCNLSGGPIRSRLFEIPGEGGGAEEKILPFGPERSQTFKNVFFVEYRLNAYILIFILMKNLV